MAARPLRSSLRSGSNSCSRNIQRLAGKIDFRGSDTWGFKYLKCSSPFDDLYPEVPTGLDGQKA